MRIIKIDAGRVHYENIETARQGSMVLRTFQLRFQLATLRAGDKKLTRTQQRAMSAVFPWQAVQVVRGDPH